MGTLKPQLSFDYVQTPKYNWGLYYIQTGLGMNEEEFTKLRSYVKTRLLARKLLGKSMLEPGMQLLTRDIKEQFAHEFSNIPTVWLNKAIKSSITIINTQAKVDNGKYKKKSLRLIQKPKKIATSASEAKIKSPSPHTESDPLTLLATPSPTKRLTHPTPCSSGESAAFHETLIYVWRCDDDGIGPQYKTLYSMSDIKISGSKVPEAQLTIDDISWDVFLLLLLEDGLSRYDEDQVMYQLDGEPMIVTRERVFKNCIRHARTARATRAEFWIQSEVKPIPMPSDNRPMEDQRRARLRQLTDISRLNRPRNWN